MISSYSASSSYTPEFLTLHSPRFNKCTVISAWAFVAETKGSLDKMELRGVEKAKTECAKQLFNSISTNTTRYGVVDKFENLYNIINGID